MKRTDIIPSDEDLDRVLPFMKIVGGKRPVIRITGARLRHAYELAQGRAFDTGTDVRILDQYNKTILDVEEV